MAKYLHLFDSENAFQSAYNGEDYEEPWVSLTEDQSVGDHVDYNKVAIWLDLTGLERPYAGGDGTEIVNGPLTTPTGTVFVKEPDGSIKEYTFITFVGDNDETIEIYSRQTTPQEVTMYNVGGYDIYFDAENNKWVWYANPAPQGSGGDEEPTR